MNLSGLTAKCQVLSAAALHPLQCSFSPDPDVPDDQDAEEDEHLNQPECSQRLELHRPRKQKDGLNIENHEQDGNNIVADGVTSSGAVDGIDAALVGHQFRPVRIV